MNLIDLTEAITEAYASEAELLEDARHELRTGRQRPPHPLPQLEAVRELHRTRALADADATWAALLLPGEVRQGGWPQANPKALLARATQAQLDALALYPSSRRDQPPAEARTLARAWRDWVRRCTQPVQVNRLANGAARRTWSGRSTGR